MDSDNSTVSILLSISLPEISHVIRNLSFTHGCAELRATVFKEVPRFLPVTRSRLVTAGSELSVWQRDRRLFFSHALFCTDWH